MTKQELVKHYKEQIVLIKANMNHPTFSKEGKAKCKVLLDAYDQFITYLKIIE